eukprot:350508-Chlamydomonas_euryale.AAC.1
MEAWSDRNLLGPERHCALVQQVMTSRFADFLGLPEEDDPFDHADDSPVARALQRLGPRDATTLATEFEEDLATLRLNPKQQAIFDSITSRPCGKAAVFGFRAPARRSLPGSWLCTSRQPARSSALLP